MGKNTKVSNSNMNFNKILTVFWVALLAIISCMVLYLKWNSKTKADYYQEYIKQGKEYMEQGYYVEAINEFKQAELIRSDENVQVAIAECYLGLGDYATFKSNSEQIQKLFGTNEKLYEDIAYYYGYMNDSYNQINTLRQGVAQYPESSVLKLKYDTVKGKYIQAGYNVEDVISVGDRYMVVSENGRQKVVGSTLTAVGSEDYDQVYDISVDPFISQSWEEAEMLYSAKSDGVISYYDNRGYKRRSPDKSYLFLGAPRDGYALVQSSDGWSYIDTDFNELGLWFQDATAFNGGFAAVKKDGKWAFIDKDFQYITEFVYDHVVCDEFKCLGNAGVAFAKKGNSYVMVNVEGELKIDKVFTQAKTFRAKNGYAAVECSGKWHLVDTAGNIIETVKCDELCSTSNGMSVYRDGDKWGYVGVGDGIYVDASLEAATEINRDGYGAIKSGKQWMIIHFLRFEPNQGL